MLGCVYRLTSPAVVVDAVIPIETCVIVDGQQTRRDELRRRHDNGQPLSTIHLPGFDEVRLPRSDGSALIIGVGDPVVDPVRPVYFVVTVLLFGLNRVLPKESLIRTW